jgi:hypothetical protein
MTKKHLPRRLVLRGALMTGASLALPLPILEGMLPARRYPSAS